MTPLRVLPLVLVALVPALRAQFAPGNIVVTRIGDGAAALTNASTAAFLDASTTSGSLIRSVALPTAASGPNFQCTNSGSATSEGILTLSTDGRYLVCAGYGANPGVASIAASSTTGTPPVPRVVARIDMAGNIDTSTAITDGYSGNNIRSAASLDGSGFWTAGPSATGVAGVRHALLGGSTSTQIGTNLANCRVVGIANGQLYTSSSSGAFQGVSTVGTGLPTSAATVTLLPGFPTTAGPSAYDFFFADANTVYVADDRGSASAGGIQKWTFSAATWTLQYTLNPAPTLGCRGLHGVVSGGVVTLFAITTESTANHLVTVTDTGAAATFTTIATAGTNVIFRGVRRVPGTYLTFGAGCPGSLGVPGNVGTSAPNIGSAFSARITNLPLDVAFFIFGWSSTTSVFGPLPFSLAGFGAPGCSGRVSTDSVVLITGVPSSHFATFNLAIPNNAIYLGTTFHTQALGLSPGTNAMGAVTSDANRAIVGN